MKVKVLTDENWLLQKGKTYPVKTTYTDGTIIVDLKSDLAEPVLFRGEYEVVEGEKA